MQHGLELLVERRRDAHVCRRVYLPQNRVDESCVFYQGESPDSPCKVMLIWIVDGGRQACIGQQSRPQAVLEQLVELDVKKLKSLMYRRQTTEKVTEFLQCGHNLRALLLE